VTSSLPPRPPEMARSTSALMRKCDEIPRIRLPGGPGRRYRQLAIVRAPRVPVGTARSGNHCVAGVPWCAAWSGHGAVCRSHPGQHFLSRRIEQHHTGAPALVTTILPLVDKSTVGLHRGAGEAVDDAPTHPERRGAAAPQCAGCRRDRANHLSQSGPASR
jgi:hypothetical protein